MAHRRFAFSVGPLVAGLFLAVALPSSLTAQELSGTWEIESETPRGPQFMTLTVVEEDGVLTGTITRAMRGGGGGGGRGAGGGGPRGAEISDGVVDGTTFSFSMVLSRGGNSFSQEFEGTFDGDEMTGVILGGRGEREFTGRRVE